MLSLFLMRSRHETAPQVQGSRPSGCGTSLGRYDVTERREHSACPQGAPDWWGRWQHCDSGTALVPTAHSSQTPPRPIPSPQLLRGCPPASHVGHGPAFPDVGGPLLLTPRPPPGTSRSPRLPGPLRPGAAGSLPPHSPARGTGSFLGCPQS